MFTRRFDLLHTATLWVPLFFVLFTVSAANAALIWSAVATMSDGAALSTITPNSQLTIDISVTTSSPNEALALTASVSGYSTRIYSLNVAASTVPDALFCDTSVPSVGCTGGLPQSTGGISPLPPYELEAAPGVGRTVIFNAVQLGVPAAGTGSNVQNPQFSIVFDVGPIFDPPDVSIFTIGVSPIYGDGYISASGGESFVSNATVQLTAIPEPTTTLLLGLGLLGLATQRPH
jgi:hypothetical protein